MTQILGVDTGFRPSPQPRDSLQSEDFARELAKLDEKAQDDSKSNQGTEYPSPTPTGIAQAASLSSKSIAPEPSPKVMTLTEKLAEPILTAGKVVQAAQAVPAPVSVTATVGKAEPVAPTTVASIDMLNAAEGSRQLTLASLTSTGATEVLLDARVFGWHAMAQAYLSELTFADGMPVAQGASEGTQSFSSALPNAIPDVSVGSDVETVTTADPNHDATPLAGVSLVQDDVADDATLPGMAELVLADGTANSYWSERSLRFTRQSDGANVAWLRDYRLRDGEAPNLIQLVLNDAKAKGLMLNKIMLNGREVWASPAKQSGVNDVN